MKLSYRNYTNVTRHMTTTRQGHVLMASLTFTGLIGGEEGTSERANCLLLTMGHEPHLILILVWFALFCCQFRAESWTMEGSYTLPFGTRDNGRMVQHGANRYGKDIVFCGTGLGQPHQWITCLSTVHGMDLDWPVLGSAETIEFRFDNMLLKCIQTVPPAP